MISEINNILYEKCEHEKENGFLYLYDLSMR